MQIRSYSTYARKCKILLKADLQLFAAPATNLQTLNTEIKQDLSFLKSQIV
jgi:hypothetical protein